MYNFADKLVENLGNNSEHFQDIFVYNFRNNFAEISGTISVTISVGQFQGQLHGEFQGQFQNSFKYNLGIILKYLLSIVQPMVLKDFTVLFTRDSLKYSKKLTTHLC